ncbi:MAG: fatty acid hydroxylase, partial [Bacteroidota bacterium]
MNYLIYTLVTLAAVLGMEFVAWAAHKYLMHGFLWVWHEDHHNPAHNEGFFEKNDLFFLVFAIPSACCYIFGSIYADSIFWLFFVGVGISIYGIIYFLIH